MKQLRPFDPEAVLQPVRRRLALAQAMRWTLRGLAVGAAVGIVVLVIAHFRYFPVAPAWGLGAVVLGALVGAAFGSRRQPDTRRAARVADQYFKLHDRLTTALEFTRSDAPFMSTQRAETHSRVQAIDLIESARGQIDRRDVAPPTIVVAALVALFFWGTAPAAHVRAAHPAADALRVRQAATTQMPRITKRLEKGLTPADRKDPALRKLEAALAVLRRQLLHTSTRAAALKAISTTQLHLQQFARSLHPVNNTAVAQLNSSLSSYMNSRQRAAASGGKRQALAAAAKLLEKLSKRLSTMTTAQRAALAQALAQAANNSSDTSLRASLHGAASALAYKDPQSASSALQQAAQALSGTPGAEKAQSSLQGAGNELDSLKNSVSGVTPSTGNEAPGAPGGGNGGASQPGGSQGSGIGSGKGSGTGHGQGQGSGKGSGQGAGQGQGSGKGSGNGNGKGGSGGHGQGGGGGNAGHHGHGQYATVYAPSRQGNGPQSQQTGPVGQPQSGPVVPYQQVVGRYTQAAHAALDRSALPPSTQQYVQKYFSAISR